MRPLLVAIAVSLTAGCAIETHKLGVQKGCDHLTQGERQGPIPVERVRKYYVRSPDEENQINEGTTELVYYTTLYGQQDPIHWSGYVVYFLFVPVIPLLIPHEHHGEAYLISGGTVVECTNYWHETEGTPRFHI